MGKTVSSLFIAQKLKTVITSSNRALASTPDGNAWVIKALHPSDPITEVHGLPDLASGSTVVMSYYNVFRISPPVGDTWGFDYTVIPDVLHQGNVTVLDASGLALSNIPLVNQSVNSGTTPVSYSEAFAAWRTLGIEAHRLLSYGVTCYQDGPALANQGTLVASQYEVQPLEFYPTENPVATPSAHHAFVKVRAYQFSDQASYANSQHLPNAYFGESKDGCYLPLRLTDFERFRTTAGLSMYSNLVGTNGYVGYGETALPAGTPPYSGAVPFSLSTATNLPQGSTIYEALNSFWAGISARNLSTQTSFAIYTRVCVECRVTPSSMLAPHAQMAPSYDPVAIDSYYRISRELKDAYPADYNDLGKLWSVIKSAASVVGKALSAVPGIPGLVGSAIPAVVGVVDAIAGSRKKAGTSAHRDSPSAAAIQRARKAIASGRRK
jgi:hypothetical protein